MVDSRISGLTESKPENVLTIVAMLNARSATGVLRYEPAPDSEYVIELLFREGKLLFATTNQLGARTAEFLVRRGVLTSEQATGALREARRRGRLFHGYLVDCGLLEREALQDLLYQRTEELLHAVLSAGQGRILFELSPLQQFDPRIPVVDEELFGRLLTYRNLWPRAYAKLPDPELVLRRVPGIETSPAFPSLSEVERAAFAIVDGRQPLRRLLDGRRDRVELRILLAQFLDVALLEIVAPAAVPEAPSRQAAGPQPAPASTEPAAAAPARPAEQRQAEDSELDLDMVPVLPPGIELTRIPAAGLTMDDFFVLSQIDGHTSLRQLMSITGMREKPLFTLMHHVLQSGFVSLRPREVPGPPVRSVRPHSRVSATQSRPQPPPEPRPPILAAAPEERSVPGPVPPSGAPEPMPVQPADPKAEALRLHARALEAYNAQNFPVAEEILRRAVSLDEASARIRAHLALVLAERKGQVHEAARMAEDAIDDDPLDGQCFEAIGLIHVKLGNYGEARRCLETAMILDRKSVPSSAKILEELKAYQPNKRDVPEDFWSKISKLIRLKA
jgi:hypothetical protein